VPIPAAPYLNRRLRDVPHLAEVWSYINPFMLYGKNLGYKGNFEKDMAQHVPLALELFHKVEDLKREAAEFMKVRAVWQFFEAERDGNSIHLFEAGASSPVYTFAFGRQRREDGLCLSDYVLEAEEGKRDHVALLAVNAGECIRERAEEWKRQGEFFKSIAIQALATETAEGTTEWLHRRLREDWGFPDSPAATMQDRFTSRYRGKRYSPGYPACPNMADQAGIWKLLRPEEIGLHLTESWMMEPEAAVSAFVFHHPDCAYFTADEGDAIGDA
jgi:5-methyltetrahydrofolate--homocysteine methyltransferase